MSQPAESPRPTITKRPVFHETREATLALMLARTGENALVGFLLVSENRAQRSIVIRSQFQGAP